MTKLEFRDEATLLLFGGVLLSSSNVCVKTADTYIG